MPLPSMMAVMKNRQTTLKRLLLADGSIDVSERLREQLGTVDNLAVLGPARNGKELLSMFTRYGSDSVVLDFQIPGINSLEIVERIRARDGNCVVIVLTFNYNELVHNCCIDSGADYVIDKTDNLSRVVEIVRELATNSHD